MIEVKLIDSQMVAEDIRAFDLADPQGLPLPAFSAGAHIDVHLPGGLIRQYSLCNSPHDRTRYRIGVLREPDSRGGSVAMHNLDIGGTLTISEPRNLFPLHAEADYHVLLAGGIGITPLLCMAERLSKSGDPFELHYFVRSESRAAFRERLQSTDLSRHVRLHYDDVSPDERFDLATALATASRPGAHVYVCGPGGFIEFALRTARDAGFTDAQLHREYFAARPIDEAMPSGEFQVRIASSGQLLHVSAEETVLAVLARHHIAVPVSCEQGVCGTCVTRVLDGQPLHRDVFMSDEEHARNDQFTPCCSRSLSPVLVLDL